MALSQTLVPRLKRRGAPSKFHEVMPGSSSVASPRAHGIRSAARLEAALSSETLPPHVAPAADDHASLSTSLTGSIDGAVEVAPAMSPHAPPGARAPRRAGALLNRDSSVGRQGKGGDSLRGRRSFASAANR